MNEPVRCATRWLGMALLPGLAACASMVPKLDPPTIDLTAVALEGGSAEQEKIHLTLHAMNPNDRAIAVRGIDCMVDLAGTAFAQGQTDAAFELPAHGEVDFGVDVIANLNTALAVIAGSLGHRNVDYRLYGQVHLRSGLLRTIPFDHKGRVHLPM